MTEMSQRQQELEFEGDFDPEELEDSEDEPVRYVFDPDTEDNQDEYVMYDPRRRRRTRPKTRTRWRTRVKRVYRRARKKLRKKPAFLGWQTLLAIPITVVSFLVSMQQDTLAWYQANNWENMGRAFSPFELLKTLAGGWGRPKDIMAYLKNVFTSPLGLGGIALAVYALLPFKRLPLKRIALIVGGSLLLGSLIGSAMHASNGNSNSNNIYSGSAGNSGISEREAYSHVLQSDPFNR